MKRLISLINNVHIHQFNEAIRIDVKDQSSRSLRGGYRNFLRGGHG